MFEKVEVLGELIPVGGGDPIPLLKQALLIGRRESCDVVLRFHNVSAHHCQLLVVGGYWYAKDLNSRNGIKINGVRTREKRLDPGDELAIAKHRYTLKYDPALIGAIGPPPAEDILSAKDVLHKSLLNRAGLETAASSQYRISKQAEAEQETERYHYDALRELERDKVARAQAEQREVPEDSDSREPPTGSPEGYY
jgi:adenylate cyclase